MEKLLNAKDLALLLEANALRKKRSEELKKLLFEAWHIKTPWLKFLLHHPIPFATSLNKDRKPEFEYWQSYDFKGLQEIEITFNIREHEGTFEFLPEIYFKLYNTSHHAYLNDEGIQYDDENFKISLTAFAHWHTLYIKRKRDYFYLKTKIEEMKIEAAGIIEALKAN